MCTGDFVLKLAGKSDTLMKLCLKLCLVRRKKEHKDSDVAARLKYDTGVRANCSSRDIRAVTQALVQSAGMCGCYCPYIAGGNKKASPRLQVYQELINLKKGKECLFLGSKH